MPVEPGSDPRRGSTPPAPPDVHADRLLDESAGTPARRQRVRRLLAANRAVADEFALPALYRRVTENGAWLVDASVASLAVIGPESQPMQFLTSTHGGIASTEPADAADPEQVASLARGLAPGDVQIVRRTRTTPQTASPWRSGGVVVPIHYRQDVVALLLVQAVARRPFTPADQEALGSFAVTAGIAIENARLYEESRRRQLWLQEAASLVSGPLATATEEGALELVAESVRQLADAEHVLLWPAPGHTSRVLVARAGESVQAAAQSLRPQDSLVATALKGDRGVCGSTTDDYRGQLVQSLRELGLGPILVLGWGGRDDTRFMVVGRRAGRPPFSMVDLDLAKNFTDQMDTSLQVQRARLLQQHVRVLEERERIGNRLRDDVVQGLFAAGLEVQAVRSAISAPAVRTKLDEVVGLLDSSIARLRRSVFDLEGYRTDRHVGQTDPAVLHDRHPGDVL